MSTQPIQGSPRLALPEPADVYTHAFRTAEEQVRSFILEHPDALPTLTEQGKWVLEDDPWAPQWSAGFLAGMMWLFSRYDETGWWRERAEHYSLLMENRKHDTGTHDVGFLFTPSWGRWHDVAPDERTAEVLITAGRTLAGRFMEKGQYLCSWVDPGSTFVDIMMNLDLIYRASVLSGDQGLADIATAHALTSRRFLVRGDGTSVHEGWFDTETGMFVRTETHQGYRSDSSWVRGHSWALYGFGTVFSWTGDTRFLDTAIALADTYIERTGDRLVPPNDWDEPDPVLPYEASAGSVIAAGMLQLGDLLGAEGAAYSDYGYRLTARLCQPEFLAAPGSGWEGILKHAVYHLHNDKGVDESIMWGDHYLVEALDRIIRRQPSVAGGGR